MRVEEQSDESDEDVLPERESDLDVTYEFRADENRFDFDSHSALSCDSHMTRSDNQFDATLGELLTPHEDVAIPTVRKPSYKWWSNYRRADGSDDSASDLEISSRKACDLFTRHRRSSLRVQ